MIKVPMYPLRFEPIYQYRLWGGRRLAELLAAPLSGDGPIGDAWLLSDRDDHPSKVAAGPLKGSTIRQCEHFSLWRHTGQSPFTVGAAGTPRVLVCIDGKGELEHSGTVYPVGRGDVVLLPAEVGACSYRPKNALSLLEVALPD